MNKIFFARLDDAIKLLDELKIKKDDFIVVGSSVLSQLSLRSPGDIDIAIRPSVYKKIILNPQIKNKILKSGTINLTNDCQILLNRYAEIRISDQALFDNKSNLTFLANNIFFAKPELETAKKIVRNYDKDIVDVDLLINYAVQHDNWDWELLNYSKPLSRKELLYKFCKKGIRHPIKSFFIFKELVQARLNRGLSLYLSDEAIQIKLLDIGILVQNHMKDGYIDRYDFLLRKRVFDSYRDNQNNKEDFLSCHDVREYSLMQKYRGYERGTINKFSNLMDSILHYGYDLSRFPILLTRSGSLYDGSHRLACALSLGLTHVAVRLNKFIFYRPEYSREWFEERFESSLLNDLDRTANEILIRTGAAFQLLIWPSAYQFNSEITDYLNSFDGVRIISQNNNFYFNSESEFEKFTRSFYHLDGISDWKIARKIKYMKNFTPQIKILVFSVDDPRYRLNTSTFAPLSDKVAKIKGGIRNKFSKKFQNYFPDIICHCGDNPQMNREILSLVESFGFNYKD